MEDFGTYYLRMLGKENDELKDKINNTIEYINQIEKSGHIDAIYIFLLSATSDFFFVAEPFS